MSEMLSRRDYEDYALMLAAVRAFLMRLERVLCEEGPPDAQVLLLPHRGPFEEQRALRP